MYRQRLVCALGALAALALPGPAPAEAAGLEPIRTLGWAGGAVTVQEAGRERPARGPAGVGVDAAGALLVVDTLARRVLRVPTDGPPEVVWAAAEALEPVAALGLPGGGFAVLDRVRREVALAKDGETVRAARLPHGLLHLAGLAPVADGRVALVSAYQESFPVPLTAPSAPSADSAAWFAARLPGVPLPDGRVATVERQDDGAVTLRWLAPPALGAEWELAEAATVRLQPPARAARVVGGTAAGAVFLEVDHDEPGAGAAARFGRRLVRVLPAGQGKGVASVTLPTEDLLYVPFAMSAVAPDGSVVVLLPAAEGLRLLRWRPPVVEGGAR